MGVPGVVAELPAVVLRDPLREPAWHGKTGDGIGNDPVGIAVQDVRPPLRFILKPLKIKSRKLSAEFQGGLNLNDVGEFMRHHVAQPVVRPAEVEIEGRCPDLDLVVEKICRPVREIVIVLDDETDLPVGLVMVQRRHRRVNILRDLRNDAGGAFCSGVIVNVEMLRLDGPPRQLGVVKFILGGGCGDEKQHQIKKTKSRPTHPSVNPAVVR